GARPDRPTPRRLALLVEDLATVDARPEHEASEQCERRRHEGDRDEDADQRRQREAGPERADEVEPAGEDRRGASRDRQPRDQDRRQQRSAARAGSLDRTLAAEEPAALTGEVED